MATPPPPSNSTNSNSNSNSWLAFPRPVPGARARLFCFPFAGGGLHIFRDWPGALGPAVEVCPVQLPGRGLRLRERPFDRVGPLVGAMAAGLRPYLDRPFALFGHSLGGLLAFELARALRRRYDLAPARLFVAASRAPQLPDLDPPIHALPEAEFVEALRRYGGTPVEALENAELRELLLPAVRADLALSETYAYADEPPLTCPISVFGAEGDELVRREELEAWRAQTGGAYSLRLFPGGHFFLNTAPALLLEALAEELGPLGTRRESGRG